MILVLLFVVFIGILFFWQAATCFNCFLLLEITLFNIVQL